MHKTGIFFAADGDKIIEQLLQGGAERRRGEEALFSSYCYFIDEAIRKYSLSEDESFNAYSDTVLSAVTKIINGSFEGRSSLKTWLFQIFHNKCVDLLRKKTTNKSSVHRTAPISDLLNQLSDNTKTVIQQLIDKNDIQILKEQVSLLGENCRQLLMSWAEGFSDREITAFTEYKTADVVKTSRLRCLEKLRQLYKKQTAT